jgi:hypothetical protein
MITCRVLSEPNSTINSYFAEGLPASFKVSFCGNDGKIHNAQFFPIPYHRGIKLYVSEDNCHVRMALACDIGLNVSTYQDKDGHQMMVLCDRDLSAEDEPIAPGEFFVPLPEYCEKVVAFVLARQRVA